GAWRLARSAAAWPFAAWPWVWRSATEDAGWPSVSAWDDPAWQSAWASTYAWAPTYAWGSVYAWASTYAWTSEYASRSRWLWRWARGVAPGGRHSARARDWPNPARANAERAGHWSSSHPRYPSRRTRWSRFPDSSSRARRDGRRPARRRGWGRWRRLQSRRG